MSRPRNGKIARLPRKIRDSLNSRLDSSAQSPEILAWLNSLPEVTQFPLARDFESRPINEQNLSEWRQGGFRDWQLRQESRERLDRFLDLYDEPYDPDRPPVSDRLARALAVELATATHQLLEQTTDPKERFQLICHALRQVQEIRKDQRRAIRMAEHAEAREQAELDAIDADHQREISEKKARATNEFWDLIRRDTLVEAFGNGQAAKAAAEYLTNIDRVHREEEPLPPLPPDPRYDQPPRDRDRERLEKLFHSIGSIYSEPKPPASPTPESNLIKPNQTE